MFPDNISTCQGTTVIKVNYLTLPVLTSAEAPSSIGSSDKLPSATVGRTSLIHHLMGRYEAEDGMGGKKHFNAFPVPKDLYSGYSRQPNTPPS